LLQRHKAGTVSRFIFNQKVEVTLCPKFFPHSRAKQRQADDMMAAAEPLQYRLVKDHSHQPSHSFFSSSSVMVPMVICMRTCTRTGSLRRSSVSQT
jgi:hypothetical protein